MLYPMTSLSSVRSLALTAALLVSSLAYTGCGAKEEEAAQAPVAEKPAADAAQASNQAEESTTESTVQVFTPADIKASMTAADSALKVNDYEKATDALLKVQLSGALKNNDQAKLDHYQRMVQLQQKLAEAAASGDAKATRAAALLRQASGAP